MEAVSMENVTIPKTPGLKPEDVKNKVEQRLELDKGKSLDEIYHDECDRLYNNYLKMEAGEPWNR